MNWLKSEKEQHYFSPKYPSRIPLKVTRGHTYQNRSRFSFGDISTDIRVRGPLAVFVDPNTMVIQEMNNILIYYDIIIS